MIKKFLPLLLICITPILSAAFPFPKTAALSKIKQPRNLLSVPKHLAPNHAMQAISPQVVHPVLRPSWHNYLTNQVLSAAIKPANFLEFKATAPIDFQQQSHIYDRYINTMETFGKIKPLLTPLLYYQTIPAEKRTLVPAEKQQLLEKIIPLYVDLRTLNVWIEDLSAQRALTYVESTLQTIDPNLLHVLKGSAQPQYLLPQDVDVQTFCLYPDRTQSLLDPTKYLAGKRVAIINDDTSLLQIFDSWYKFGLLFPQATVSIHGSVEQFLLWAQSHTPDVIFTDIQLGDGTGYYIAYRLRNNGYTGGIIALTSYMEDKPNVQFLQAQGFDGLVSLQSSTRIPLVRRMTQAAQVYFQRQNQP